MEQATAAPLEMQRLGVVMEPDPSIPEEVEGVLNPATRRRARGPTVDDRVGRNLLAATQRSSVRWSDSPERAAQAVTTRGPGAASGRRGPAHRPARSVRAAVGSALRRAAGDPPSAGSAPAARPATPRGRCAARRPAPPVRARSRRRGTGSSRPGPLRNARSTQGMMRPAVAMSTNKTCSASSSPRPRRRRSTCGRGAATSAGSPAMANASTGTAMLYLAVVRRERFRFSGPGHEGRPQPAGSTPLARQTASTVSSAARVRAGFT